MSNSATATVAPEPSQTNGALDAAVEAAVKAGPTEAPAFPVEGIDLGPAFQVLIEKIQPVRNQLLKMLSSTTDRRFALQRELLVELQSLTRAFDVLAGFVSPDGTELAPMAEPDPEQVKRRHQHIDESVQRSSQGMAERARHFSNVPLEPIRVDRRGAIAHDPPPAPADRSPGWLRRRKMQ